MSLEAAIAELTAAVRENTEVHARFAEIARTAAKSAQPGKTVGDEAPEEAKAAKTGPQKKAAPKKAAAKKSGTARKRKPVSISGAVDESAIRQIARAYLDGEDEDEREAKKKNVSAAFEHLGVKKLSDLEDDTERAKLAAYIAHWEAGADLSFDAIDDLVAEAAGDDDENMDEMLD